MKKTTYLLGILLTGILGSFLVWYIGCCDCDNNSTCKTKASKEITTVKNTQGYPFELKDKKGYLNYRSQDNFNFYENGAKIITPVATSLQTGVEDLKTYLSGNAARAVDVTGFYTSDEVNNSPFPNLGLARANAIKNYLVANGIDSQSINLKSELKNDLVAENSIYKGPVQFYTHELNKEEIESSQKELETIHDHIVSDPLLLHFKFGDNTLRFTDEQRNKLREIITYTDHNHNAVIDVIGHSDNVGNAALNTKLGMERASFVKTYLVGIGINADQIKVDSKGPNQPIATNDTAEGRAKNRRVEIILE